MSLVSPLLDSWVAAHEPTRRLRRPEFGIDQLMVEGRRVAVQEQTVAEKPFCQLVHFSRESRRADPRLLVVAPLSGHFAALLRDMLAALIPSHDLYLMDWRDAREVPFEEGSFGIDENIGYIVDFIRHLGGELHLIGLCQSAMPSLAATALLAGSNDPASPRTLTLIGGMLDTRINPTRIDRIAAMRSPDWLERNAVTAVPARFP